MLIAKVLQFFNKNNVFSVNCFYGVGSYKLQYLSKIFGLTSIRKTNLNFLKRKRFIHTAFKEDTFNSFIIGNDLIKKKKFDRDLLAKTECLRSLRFFKGLSCNGQRTQTNCRTSKKLAGLVEMKKKRRYAKKKK